MSRYTDLVDALVTQVGTVTGAGNVYGYTRFISDPAQYLTLFQYTDGSIRAWWVSPADPGIDIEADSFGSDEWTYHFLVTGVMGLQDSANTERTFVGLVESVAGALTGLATVGTSGETVDGSHIAVGAPQHRQFGSVLCHYCEIRVDIPVEVAS